MDKNNDILMQAIDNRIDAYIRGTMTDEEEAAFKAEIKADPELRNHVLATVSLIKGIREQEATKEKMLIPEPADRIEDSKVRKLLWWATSIAAVFAIFFGYQKDKRFNELSDMVSPYYAEYNINEYARGDVNSATVAHLYTLFNSIQNERNMSNYIKELEPIYANLEHDFTYSAYSNDIAWNLAVAYIKDDQINKAIQILDKLINDNPDTPIAIKAQELLNKLREYFFS